MVNNVIVFKLRELLTNSLIKIQRNSRKEPIEDLSDVYVDKVRSTWSTRKGWFTNTISGVRLAIKENLKSLKCAHYIHENLPLVILDCVDLVSSWYLFGFYKALTDFVFYFDWEINCANLLKYAQIIWKGNKLSLNIVFRSLRKNITSFVSLI